MKLGEPDASGRRRPEPSPAPSRLDCDLAIIAIGSGANPLITRTTPGLAVNKWGYIVADEAGKTKGQGVAGGDIVTGAATVIKPPGRPPSRQQHPPVPDLGVVGLGAEIKNRTGRTAC